MSLVRALLPAFGAGLAFTVGGPGDALSFDPEEGSSVTKVFVVTGEYDLDEISLIANGQDLTDMIGSIEMNMTQDSRIEVTDVYESVADGRPLLLLRTFDTLETSLEMDVSPAPEELPQFESSSELEGLTVAFKWNEEEQEYELEFPDDDADEGLLEGLNEDMDMRAFLPDSEVDEDSSWSVELSDLGPLLMPGGDLHMRPEGLEVDEESMAMFEELFSEFGDDIADMFDGECICTYEGMRTQDDMQLAEISIELEVSATIDLSELLNTAIRAAMEQAGADDSVSFSLDTADLSLDFEGAGVLLWSPTKGRMFAFQLSGDAIMAADLSIAFDVEGRGQGVDASMELSGEFSQEVTTSE